MRTRILPVALVASSLLLAGCEAPPPDEPAVRPVVTEVVPEPGGRRDFVFSATVRAAEESELSFRVAGELLRVAVRVGQRVGAGDLVARLDPTDFELRVRQLEAQLAQAEALRVQARSEYERTRTLYEADNASAAALETARAKAGSADAQVEATRRSLDLARQQLGRTTLRAPVAGRVAEVPVEPHESVRAGQPIVRLSTSDELEVELGVPEAVVSRVEIGQEAVVELDAVPGRELRGRIVEVGIDISSAMTYPVVVRLTDGDPRVRPGMVGEALLIVGGGDAADSPAVPPVAVVGRPDGGHHVFVLDEGSAVVRRREVTPGALRSDGLEILEGLAAGERIVVRGVHRLKDGQRVRSTADAEASSGGDGW